ncbi:class I SAM-dependent methyltransferase [Actinomycetospora termitidis]|uniref:Class I SAM-dependent methyltransferase n=1 Tax=Actinomycetospora termitidis TaxID=3053470 RepID=A0ABT7MD64_9PSEU|nr:class I SAM-dependent methyltransferase [Actinomycetospora sp. Odt1-22]MDL5158411.1 class I SAM-dependent methyltransferase [Actinomycetospora sp. Odt1-22]
MTHEHGHQQHDHPQHDHAGMAEILDLDAEVLAEPTAALVAALPVREAPRRVVDLGAGTGVGTLALLDRFPAAHVLAVDASDDHLRRLHEKAASRGLAGRVETLRADLDAAWPDLGRPDLVWASASLHHLADVDAALHRLRDLLAPRGLLVVVEPDGFPRFLPDDAPEDRPGVERRAHEAADRRAAEHMPHRGADLGPTLRAAGFTVELERKEPLAVGGAAVGRYALLGLGRLRHGVADALSAEDLTALDRLLDPEGPGSLLRRDDLAVRTTRSVWAARA